MATYKVIQDIEAEDHILGPLTLRQFIYALVAIFCVYLNFLALTKNAAFLMAIFLPPALFFGFLAFPFGKDQPTEVWALAKLRFFFKPRLRIWDQSGIKELVTITVPKKIERTFTDGLSQNEVRSRLSALANTIDSRGWAIKNVNVNLYSQPSLLATADSDRLIDISSIPQPVPDFDVQASDDILDETSNPLAQQFTQMIGASTQAHRQQLIEELNEVRTDVAKTQAPAQSGAPADYWFLNQAPEAPTVPANSAIFTKAQVVTPGALDDTTVAADVTPEEAAIVARAKQQKNSQAVSYTHLRTIQPLGSAPAAPAADPAPTTPNNTSGKSSDPAILELANNNDLNVATLARQAKKAKGEDLDDEVVISLH